MQAQTRDYTALGITIGPATHRMEEDFRQLLHCHIMELSKLGGEIVPTDRTLDFFCGLFIAYIEEVIPGAVVAAIDSNGAMIGFSFAGAAGPPAYDTTFGATAYGWGTYVIPMLREHGLATAMRNAMRSHLRDLGFDTIVGGIHTNNMKGAASLEHSPFRIYQYMGYEKLR